MMTVTVSAGPTSGPRCSRDNIPSNCLTAPAKPFRKTFYGRVSFVCLLVAALFLPIFVTTHVLDSTDNDDK